MSKSPHCRSPLSCPTSFGLLVALAGPPTLVLISRRAFGDGRSIGVQALLQLAFCAFAVIVVFVVIRLERLPLQSIGLRPPSRSTLVSALLLTFILVFLLPPVTASLVRALGQEGANAGVARLAVLPAWFRVFLGATSGVVEETLYRGYAVERLAAITGRLWLGAAIATVAFGAAHIPYWGLGFALAADLPVGVVLVLCYVWRRDLLANMFAHSAALMVAFFTTVPWSV